MDRILMDYIDRKMSGRDYRRGRDNRDNRRGRDNHDYEDGRRMRDNRDYEDERRDYEDNRRGRDNRDYEDSRDYENRRDYEDNGDYHHGKMRLHKSDMKRWKNHMENADGTKGEHFDMQQIMNVADKMGLKFNDYDEKEFCLAVNMMYSDYCRTVRKYVSPDKELMTYAELARDFLEDDDGPEPSEKLALYYYCIVDNDEV
jgi:hypothetical protein